MLQIKNTLGGGKPEGLYAWKKYEIGTSYIEKTTKHEAQSNGIVITKGLTFNSNMTVKVTKATSYTFDSATGKYTLKNNISSFDVVSGVASGSTSYSTALNGYYFMLGDDTEADYMYKGCDSYSIGFTNNGDGTCKMWEQYVGNPIYAYSADTEPTYTFLDYIVSDKETAFPDGGEKGGYWYEKVRDVKIASGTITLTSQTLSITIEHGLGRTLTGFILQAAKITPPSTTNNPPFCAGFNLNKNKWTAISYRTGELYETDVFEKNTNSLIIPTIDDTKIIFPSGMYRKYESDYSRYGMYYYGEYNWIAVAE